MNSVDNQGIYGLTAPLNQTIFIGSVDGLDECKFQVQPGACTIKLFTAVIVAVL